MATPQHPISRWTRKGALELPGSTRTQERRPLTPAEFGRWLDEQQEGMAERWLVEIRSRTDGTDEQVFELIREFLYLFTSFLSTGVGPFREQVEPLLQQAAELYGNLGAHRGLAAGEAVEEIQVLREVFLRFFYTDPPGTGPTNVELRDLLQLNRLVDRAVTYASIGHTDTLFFHLFHGTGVSNAPDPALLGEVLEQVSAVGEELAALDSRSNERASESS